MNKIKQQLSAVQLKAERVAFDGILTNPDVPLIIRRGAAKRFVNIFKTAKWLGYKFADASCKIERSWRDADGNEPGQKRLAAMRRRFPKPVAFYKEDMYDKMYYYLEREVELIEGRWCEHAGDAALYGLLSDAMRWKMFRDQKSLERAMATRKANLNDIQTALEEPRALLSNGEVAVNAAMGLILTFDMLPDWETIPIALELLKVCSQLMESLGGYIDIDLPMSMIDRYGKTTPTAFFFMINLMVADFLKRHDRSITADQWVARALKFLDAAKLRAYDHEAPRFLFNPGEERMFAYPNPLFCLGLALLHRITGHQSALIEAEGIFSWMHKNIRDEFNGGYYTPCVNMMEAGEYALNVKSLSAQNYMLYASLYLYDVTGKEIYLQEIKSLLDMFEKEFYFGGLLWHSVRDGEKSNLLSHEPYCIGCNFMTTYLIAEANFTYGLGEKLLEMDGVKIEKKETASGAQARKPIGIVEDTEFEKDLF